MFLGWRVWVRSFFVFFLTTFYLFSLPLEIKTEESYELSSHMEFTAVNEFNESVDVLNNRQWHKEKKNVLLKEKHKSYWIKIELKHFLQKDKEYYFILPRNYIYFIEYFLIKENTIIENSSHGYFLQEKKNKLNSTHIIFPLNIKKNEQLTVYFKVQNYNMRNIPMKLTNSSYLIDFYQSYDFFQGIFFGVMFIMALYNFILYCILRFKPYLNYVFYAFSLSVYMAAYSGFFHRYTDLHPAFIYFLLIFGGVLFLLSSAKFFRVLFEFKKQVPRIDFTFKLISIYFVTLTIVFILLLFYGDFSSLEFIYNIISFSIIPYAFFILFSIIYYTIRHFSWVAFWYTLVWSFVGVLGAGLILMHLGIFPSSSLINYYFQSAMIFEALIFSWLLAYRIKEVENEKIEKNNLLIHQSKLATMGEMISLIAHQWRQPLSELNGIVLGIDMDNKKNKLDNNKLDTYLTDIEDVTAHLSKTINDFIHLSNPKKKIEIFKISEVIERSKKLVHMSFGDALVVEYNQCGISYNTEIYGQKSELIQVLLVLFNNTVDACKSLNIVPHVEVEVYIEEQFIILNVKDNGGGIKKEILDKLYNPYFTTKHESQGTGLGLYILKMIVEQSMNGEVRIENFKKGILCQIKIPKN